VPPSRTTGGSYDDPVVVLAVPSIVAELVEDALLPPCTPGEVASLCGTPTGETSLCTVLSPALEVLVVVPEESLTDPVGSELDGALLVDGEHPDATDEVVEVGPVVIELETPVPELGLVETASVDELGAELVTVEAPGVVAVLVEVPPAC
jgi:hypothetical protein